ncbi:MAG: rRNA maturation RNase YbeY [Polaromonas sp.]|jgi:probable rRNA maturation factor|nr:rRNA maturation RNase YbeY [Polaromonas sp.]MBK7025455.1 rRNA maturation RNase YbeY [Polaromonas sp.]MBP6088469.1 rRNA maturation RNase YbeY [Polaromonas sp.]MBP6142186.1 rRNA maturation RNase YbeY [Polaromonas sp.]MBP6156175.1 rRNA maturation RNase YbeY [Polaromonas sp.]
MQTPVVTLSLQFARFLNVAKHREALPRYKVARYIKHALQAGVQSLEITLRIVDETEGRALNASYRHKDYATNVLTFDYSAAPHVSCDIVLCAPVVEKEAHDNHKTLADHYAHLLVHGVLHAQGYDHETSKADAVKMEALEVHILAKLGITNPYTLNP